MQETERSEAKGKLGTTKKGIGPTYSSKATRNGVRISDLMRDFDKFAEKFSSLADCHAVRFKSLQVDKNAELERYKVYAERLQFSMLNFFPIFQWFPWEGLKEANRAKEAIDAREAILK